MQTEPERRSEDAREGRTTRTLRTPQREISPRIVTRVRIRPNVALAVHLACLANVAKSAATREGKAMKGIMDNRMVSISASSVRFAMWNTYDALIRDLSRNDPTNARYQLPMLRELQQAVRKLDGTEDQFDYVATVESMLAEVDAR
jgi:hypothetical protein